MSHFFDDQPLSGETLPSKEELLARVLPPKGYEGALIVQVGDHLVWKHPDDVADDDQVVFYDGDCRDVLTPDDPRLKARAA